MKTLNLVYPDKSDIKYKISKFPDGQQQVNIELSSLVDKLKFISSEGFYGTRDPRESIEIKSRLNNFQDLELIICATKSLRNLGVKEIHLYTPYFLGSRSDRQFEEDSNNYLKDIICPIINSLEFESVTILDPHSDVLEACLCNFKKEDNSKLFKWAIGEIFPHKEMSKGYFDRNYFEYNTMLVSPDAGANKKIYKLAEKIGYKGDIITCSKERDTNGKLTKCVVPINHIDHAYKDLIIIDDICDGGNTFINIVKEINEKFNRFNDRKSKIYLIVTHGIFSKGFEELSKYFDGIYCTNSYKDISDVSPKYDEFIKQLNIF